MIASTIILLFGGIFLSDKNYYYSEIKTSQNAKSLRSRSYEL